MNRGYVVVDTAGLENKPSNRAGEKAKGESRGSQATGLGEALPQQASCSCCSLDTVCGLTL